MDRRLVLPDDPLIARSIGAGAPSKRAQRARLRRAERAGILPRRIYLSSQRWAYDAAELEAALAALPRAHTATMGRAEQTDCAP
jgi:hypothetical protein